MRGPALPAHELPQAPAETKVGERTHPRLRLAGWILGPGAFLALLLWPGLGLDPLQRRTAAVVALTATFWLTGALPVGAASLLPAALLPLLGVLPARVAANAYMDDLVLLFLGAFVVALGLERWGVHRRMALAVVALVGTRPRNLVLGFMAAAALLSMWINNTATALMMLPIAVAVARSLAPPGEEVDRSFALALLLGVAYGASLGGMATPVGTAPNQVFLGQLAQRFPDAPRIGFGSWMTAWLPLVVVFLLCAWLVLTRVAIRVAAGSADAGAAVREERARQGPMGKGARRMSAVFACTALLWVTRADIELGFVTVPGWTRLLARLHGLASPELAANASHASDASVALAMAILCFAIPVDKKRGVHLMDWSTAVRLPWDVLLLIGGGFCIAASFRASGLDTVLGSGLAPLLADRPSWQVVALVVTSMTFLTEVTSNTATTNVLLPVLAQAAVVSGIHPLLVMAPATIAASAAFMLPVATPPNAVVYASGLVSIPAMARVGLWLNLLTILLTTLIFELWVKRVWNLEAGLPPWAHP